MTTSKLQEYVAQFNADDKEEGVNTILNKDAFLFLAKNIPLFECPDRDIERTYYYRWWTYRKHIRNTEDGYVVTEFYPNVEWARKHNTINCPVGHQIYEGRWIHTQEYIKDYITFHFSKDGNAGGSTKCYSNWLTDAVYAHYLVAGDKAFIVALLDRLIANHRAYSQDGRRDGSECRLLNDIGLYWQIDSWDGGEHSIGGTGIRPTINSYMYGSAMAIAMIAELAGKHAIAETYNREADALKKRVQDKLWDPEAKFYKVLRDDRAACNYGSDAPEKCESGRLVAVRELFGYIPWYFNMPDDGKGYEAAWSQLVDPWGFKAPFGPSFAERRHPGFKINAVGCEWRGASWPFATSQTITALANLLNNYKQDQVGKKDYFDTLKSYTSAHRWKKEDGATVPWIDESVNPDTGRWIVNCGEFQKTRGRYYNHSTYGDLIITGLVGLRPRSDNIVEVNPLLPENTWDSFGLDNLLYHGYILTILWDKTGVKYGKGIGLTVFANGKRIANARTLSRISGKLE